MLAFFFYQKKQIEYFFNELYIENNIFIYNFNFYNFDLILVLTKLSMLFLFILYFIYIFILLFIKINHKFLNKILYFYSTILFILLHGIFLTDNLLIFFILFEASLIPLILIILSFGSRNRKLYASFLLFYYTILGSIFFFFGILLIYLKYNTFSINLLISYKNFFELNTYNNIIFFLLFCSFCIKIPVVPFHTWLTEAHVEAPTVGSIILASLILKVGTFAFLRILFGIFANFCFYYQNIIIFLFILSILHSSLVILSIYDIKKIIAYFSIIHMNFAMIGFFTYNLKGIEGSLLLVLTHSFSSTLLFFLVGLLYESFKTRNLSYFSGLNSINKEFSFLFFLAILVNIGFPGTITFIGELNVLYGILLYNPIIGFFMIIPLFFNFIISMLLYTKIFFGSYILNFYDKEKKIFFINSIFQIYDLKNLFEKNIFLLYCLVYFLFFLFFFNIKLFYVLKLTSLIFF